MDDFKLCTKKQLSAYIRAERGLQTQVKPDRKSGNLLFLYYNKETLHQ